MAASPDEFISLAASAAMSAVGVGLALLAAGRARAWADVFGLAAGVVLLGVAAFHLAPEAVSDGLGTQIAFLLGLGLGFGLEHFAHQVYRAKQDARATARLGLAVLSVHAMLDGGVFSAAFWHDADSGRLTALGVGLHKLPEGSLAAILALQAGFSVPLAGLAALGASSLATPLGWAAAHLIGGRTESVMGPLFAGSAGLLLYVGWHLCVSSWQALGRRRRG